MFRHIAWFNEALVEPDSKGILTSPDLTVRRRCLAPACELEKRGIACSVFGNLHDADPRQVAKHLEKLHADLVIVSSSAHSALFELADAAKRLGCCVIVDFDHAALLSVDHQELVSLADLVVVASHEAASRLKEKGVVAHVIPDCETVGAQETANLWFEALKKLKVKPPPTANTNIPLADHA